jgi:hypothetical protein
MLGNGPGPWRSRSIHNPNTQPLNKNHISFSAPPSKTNKRQLRHQGMRYKQFSKGASKFTASMAMRTKFVAQIMDQIWTRGFFSCSGRVSFYAPNIRCANKLARYKWEGLVCSASPVVKQIAHPSRWRERKRKYVSQRQTACSNQKRTSTATAPDPCPTTVKIPTHLISRHHPPPKMWQYDCETQLSYRAKFQKISRTK